MQPLNILIWAIIEKKRAENEKGIEGRQGIFGTNKRKGNNKRWIMNIKTLLVMVLREV